MVLQFDICLIFISYLLERLLKPVVQNLYCITLQCYVELLSLGKIIKGEFFVQNVW